MFYGNPAIKSFQSPGGAFPQDYYGVYHMRETTSPYRDSSSVRNDAHGDTNPLEVAGLFGPAQRFQISGPNTLKMPTIPVAGDVGGIGLTVEFWIKANDTTNIQMIVDTGYGQLYGTQVYIENGGTLRVYDVRTGSTAATPSVVADGNWHFVVAQNHSLGFITIWVDTVLQVSFTSFGVPTAEHGTTAIGIGKGDLHPFDGILEEFRFATHSVLQQRIDADFRNLNPGTINDFYFVGEPITWGLAPWVIQEVTGELIPTASYLGHGTYGNYGHFRYTVRCINVAQIGSYLDFWLGLGGSGGISDGSGSGVVGTDFPATATSGNSVSVAQGGTVIGSQPIINFENGPGINLLIGNDPGDSRVNVAISSDATVFLTYGKYADLPSVMTATPGTVYFFKDSIYTHAYFDGLDWIIFADGRQMFVPSKKPWLSSSAPVDIDNGFSTMVIQTLPSPPFPWQFQWGSIGYPTGVTYTFTAAYRLTPPVIGTETGIACLFFSDGANTMTFGIFVDATGFFNLTLQTSTAFDGVAGNLVVFQKVVAISSPLVWLRVGQDGAKQTFWWSADKVRWQQVYKDDVGWFLASTRLVGWGGKAGFGDISMPTLLETGSFIDLVSFEGEVSASYTFTTTTTAVGAGTPSRELTVTLTGALTGTATFTPDDMGAGGVFYPTSVTLPAGVAGRHIGFVYIPPIGQTADCNIIVDATGGGAWGVGGLILPIGSDTEYARDSFVGTAAAPVLARTPNTGAAWTRPYNAGTIDLLLDGSGGAYASGAPNPIVRSSSISYISTNPVVLSFPGGTVAGDIAIIIAANEQNVFAVSGWTNGAQNLIPGSSFWAYKTLTSGDIATGSVSISHNGTNGTWSLTIIVGGTASIREVDNGGHGTGVTSASLATTSAVSAGDLLLIFGATRAATTTGITPGTQVGTTTAGTISGTLNKYNVLTNGAVTANYTYGAAGLADWEVIVVVQGGSVGHSEYQIPTSAPHLINDVAALYTGIDPTVLEPTVAMFGDAGAYVSGYLLYSDATGVGASAFVAGTETQFTAPTGTPLSGDHLLRIAVRLINNHQFVFFLVDGDLLTGAPFQDNSITTGYASLVPTLESAPTSSDTVCTEIRGSNADWS
jgi:hypothetical protein